MAPKPLPDPNCKPTGWNIAAALGLLAAAFWWSDWHPSKRKEPRSVRRRDASGAGPTEEGRGRLAESPSEIPAKGWKDIVFRVYSNIGEHRILALAAGMTYYTLFAIFPALAALVAIYGLFADTGTIAQASRSGVRIHTQRCYRGGARAAYACRIERKPNPRSDIRNWVGDIALESQRRDEVVV